MTLLKAVRTRRDEVVLRLADEMRRLATEAAIREWIFALDGPVELVAEMTGLELGDEETEKVFKLLDQLCQEAVVKAGGEEGWVLD